MAAEEAAEAAEAEAEAAAEAAEAAAEAAEAAEAAAEAAAAACVGADTFSIALFLRFLTTCSQYKTQAARARGGILFLGKFCENPSQLEKKSSLFSNPNQ